MSKAYILSREDATDKLFGQWIKEHREKTLMLGQMEAAELIGIPLERLKELESGKVRKSVTKRECLGIAGGYNLRVGVVLHRATESS